MRRGGRLAPVKRTTGVIVVNNHTLDVTVSGGGSVTSTDGQINTSTTDNGTYSDGSTATLTATADAGQEFIGWSGSGYPPGGVFELRTGVHEASYTDGLGLLDYATCPAAAVRRITQNNTDLSQDANRMKAAADAGVYPVPCIKLAAATAADYDLMVRDYLAILGARGDLIEIGNEQASTSFWMQCLVASYARIRAAGKKVILGAGGAQTTYGAYPAGTLSLAGALDEGYQGADWSMVDGIATHIYRDPPSTVLSVLQNQRAAINPAVPLYVTENGWPDFNMPWGGNVTLTPEQQRQRVVTMAQIARDNAVALNLRLWGWFCWNDYTDSTAPWSGHCGLLDKVTGAHKPAYGTVSLPGMAQQPKVVRPFATVQANVLMGGDKSITATFRATGGGGGGDPPPDPPPVLANFIVPNPPNPAPGDTDETQCLDFNSAEYQGVPNPPGVLANGVNERMQFVADPGGSGQTVLEITLAANDDSTLSPAGHRAEFFSNPRDLANGYTGWVVMGFRWDTYTTAQSRGGFREVWLFHQNHAPSDSLTTGPVMQLFHGLDSLGGHRCYVGYKPTRGGVAGNTTLVDVGPLPANQWAFIAYHVKWATGDTGFLDVWHRLGGLPDVLTTPDFSFHNYSTLNGASQNSRAHIGFYQQTVTDAVHGWFWGFRRGTWQNCKAGFPA